MEVDFVVNFGWTELGNDFGNSALELYFSKLIFYLPGHVAESIGRMFKVFPSEASLICR